MPPLRGAVDSCSDGTRAHACPEGEAHGACLSDCLSSPTHGTGTCLKIVAGHVCQGGGTLARDHVACCLEGLLLGHVVWLNCSQYRGGRGEEGASVDTPWIVTLQVRRRTPERMPLAGRPRLRRSSRRPHPQGHRTGPHTSGPRSGDPSGRRQRQAWCRCG